MERITLADIYLGPEIYTIAAVSTILAWEKAGQFPRRRYLDADSKTPRKPFWLRSEVEQWLTSRAQQSDDVAVKAQALTAKARASRAAARQAA